MQKKRPFSDEFENVLALTVQAVHPEEAEKFLKACKTGDWNYLQNTKVQPDKFTDPLRYHQEAMVASLLRKCVIEDPALKKQRSDEAYARWKAGEAACYRTNVRLDPFIFNMARPEDKRIAEFFSDVRKTISRILGRPPKEILGKISRKSTFLIKGERVALIDKISATPEVTENAWPWVPQFGTSAWAALRKQQLGESVLEIPCVYGNRYATVPKNATTDRSIGVEPTLNVYFQLGVGSYLKRRLRRWGLLLRPEVLGSHCPDLKHGYDSQQIHRALAKLASLDGTLATIDLSNASDTLAYNLVRLLLPYEWYELLSTLRSPYTGIPDKKRENGFKWHRLEKFSSMGNGFTFELESLIFAGIIQTLGDKMGVPLERGRNFSVYGDDLIVPTSLADAVVKTLAFCGFATNTEKTFTKGSFRESCGGDYLNGVDVRPVFIKKVPDCIGDWIVLHNQLAAQEDRYPRLWKALSAIRDQIPKHLHVGVPVELGDVGLHGVDGQVRINKETGWRQRKIVIPDLFKYPIERWDEATQWVLALYTGRGTNSVPTDDVLGYQVKWADCLV